MKRVFLAVCFFISVSILPGQPKKDVGPSTPKSESKPQPNTSRIWGSTFADYSYQARATDSAKTGANAFEFRRIYLGYDQDLSAQFAIRILIEADKFETTTSGVMPFFAKQVYLEWKNILPMSSAYFGLVQTPSLGLAEKYWGYRSLEKVILDRTGLVSINDMGLALKGKVSNDGTAGYALTVGNGRGGKVENDNFKKIYGEFYFEPLHGGVLELYADYEGGDSNKGKLTGKGFVGYQLSDISIGAEGFYRKVQQGTFSSTGVSADSNLVGASAYVSFGVVEDVRCVLRGDYYDADFDVKDAGVRELYFVGAIDYAASQDIHIMPNVLYTTYPYKVKLSGNPVLRDDIVLRLTVACAFSTQLR